MNSRTTQGLAALAALLPMLPFAQSTAPQMPGPDAPQAQCSRQPELAKPELDYRGVIHVQATMKVERGRVVMIELRSMTGGVQRRELRKFNLAIDMHVRDRYLCETDGRLQKDFKFTYE